MKAKKGEVIHKLKIARGQIDGILQMIEEDRYCVDISNQLQATQALLKSANQQILQAHIRNAEHEHMSVSCIPAYFTPAAWLRISSAYPSALHRYALKPFSIP